MAQSPLPSRAPPVQSTGIARGSPSLLSREAAQFARLAAGSPLPVLLHGETGSGKTCLARHIHEFGSGAGHPFVHVNCAAIPDGLFEREMFGHVRGAFTDARESRPGLIEEAGGGTLFLDEIGELPLGVQPKLLRVLESGTIRRLGSTCEVPVRFRLIAATNRNLEQMVRDQRFREDLFYRCAVLECRVAPLRERRRDLSALVEYFLARAPEAQPPEVAAEALELLCAYAWPGNIRELENCLSQALVYASGARIEQEHLPERVRRAPRGATSATLARGGQSYVAPDDAVQEAQMIRDALHAEGGNKTRAAQRLGMSRATLWIKLQRYGIHGSAAGETT